MYLDQLSCRRMLVSLYKMSVVASFREWIEPENQGITGFSMLLACQDIN